MERITEMWARISDAPIRAAVAVVVPTIWRAVSTDPFFWLLWVLLASNMFDTLAGRHAARARDEYSKRKSREGVVRKGIAIAVVLLIRALELVWTLVGAELGVPSTGGWAAAVITCWLVLEDIQSLEDHLIALGGRPIPLLGPVLRLIRSATGAERRLDPARAQDDA